MFDHVTIRVQDRDASERFYDTVLATLGVDRTYRTRWFSEWNQFSLARYEDGHPATRRLHIAWFAPTHERVHDFWQAGVDAGYESDGEPGPRPEYGPDYYGGFLLDPDGNSAEAVHNDQGRRAGSLDHLWIRVADVPAAKRFYETIAPHAGIRLNDDTPDRAQFLVEGGSFSLVGGDPTENVHLAFGTEDDADVDAFHAAATGAGHRSLGVPGERPRYHPGYYAAYVADPDGNNIEVVNHNRR